MPHLLIEYSATLEARVDMGVLCRVLQEAIIETGLFPTAGIRIRAHKADYAIVADGLPENDFVAMTLSVGEGRTRDQLRGAGDALFAAGREVLTEPLSAPHFSFSLEIRIIDPELSWKDTPIHARLSGKT